MLLLHHLTHDDRLLPCDALKQFDAERLLKVVKAARRRMIGERPD